MKNIILTLAATSILMGCAAASVNTVPEGKTEADQTAAEEYCIKKSGLVTGARLYWGAEPRWLHNMKARERYKQCLIDTGWLMEEQIQAKK